MMPLPPVEGKVERKTVQLSKFSSAEAAGIARAMTAAARQKIVTIRMLKAPVSGASDRAPCRRIHARAPFGCRSSPSPQPKSDLSDFGQLKIPTSGKPEVGAG